VIAQSGIKYAMIFEGVNDIGVAAADVPSQTQTGDLLIVAYQQIATRLHAANLRFFGATITPFATPKTSNYTQSYSNEERERTRQRINTFIRESDIFDAVLDFDRVLRDPAAPSQLQARYDSGDHLHPNEAGYQAIAEYFPLEIFD
jgi:lysophospholipase L1-like esterase